jgi:hypothetical protein
MGSVGPAERERLVIDAFVAASEALGLEAHDEATDRGFDVVVVRPDGPTIFVQLKWAALITGEGLPNRLRRWAETAGDGVTHLLVADRITASGRDALRQAGINWLDLRGHLRLCGPGLLIDADVPALTRPDVGRQGVSGQVGVELSALLLLNPDRRVGVRAAAEMLSRAPSSISEAFSALKAAGLVDDGNKPVVPGLFWELAEHWKSENRDVAALPVPNTRDSAALRLGMGDVESTVGWALTDTVAAVAYGAPVSIRATHPPDFYVPDQSTLRRAVQLLGAAPAATSRAARVRVAPVPMVCARRIDATEWTNEHWPLAHPLFVALDLAQDPGRGREILDGWTPERLGHRVW